MGLLVCYRKGVDEMKENYYALFLSIVKGKSAKESLMDMNICPENVKNEEED